MQTRLDDQDVIDYSDREFDLKVLKGGMNRLLYRSDRGKDRPLRVEIFFMNVRYLGLGTFLKGPIFRRLGTLSAIDSQISWKFDYPEEISVWSVRTRDGVGTIVASDVAVDECDLGAYDPSRFFLMD